MTPVQLHQGISGEMAAKARQAGTVPQAAAMLAGVRHDGDPPPHLGMDGLRASSHCLLARSSMPEDPQAGNRLIAGPRQHTQDHALHVMTADGVRMQTALIPQKAVIGIYGLIHYIDFNAHTSSVGDLTAHASAATAGRRQFEPDIDSGNEVSHTYMRRSDPWDTSAPKSF
jgi:hypothetical protein